ncbi:MAG: IclR family transcriptional regulator [Solirubrobacteraceae bacterium]
MAPGGRSGHGRGGNTGDEGSREAPWDLFDSARYSRSLAIGLTMARCFESSEALGIVDMAAKLGLGRSTTHRYAATLQALGWFEQTQERKYRLAHLSAWPGMTVLGEIALVTGCEPVLRDLRAQTGYTVSLGVLDGARVVYVQRLSAHGRGQHAADGGLRAGARVPLHCTALGHALLASLPEEGLRDVLASVELVRHTPHSVIVKRRLRARLQQTRDADGLAVSDRGFVGSERSIAAAVPEAAGNWRLAVELNAPAASASVEALLRLAGRLVRDAATQIANSLKTSALAPASPQGAEGAS